MTAARDPASDVTRALCDVVGDAHVSGSTALPSIGVAVKSGDAAAWLVRPGSAAEISEVVNLAREHRIAVVPVGNAARAPRASALGDRRRFFVDIRRMDHVLHLDETSLVAHVQAGITAIALEKILHPRGLSLGDYPPATLGSTIGGLISVRTPGKSSPRHGFVEDAVLGLSAVLADGRSIHTRVAPRRSTGPDLSRALCGSEGTLGLITSAVLRVHRRPETRYLVAHALPDLPAALAAVHLMLREEAAPAALRLYDTADARARVPAADIEDGEAVLVVATAGPTDLAACDRGLVASAVTAMGGRGLDESVARTWWDRRTGHDPSPMPAPHLQLSATPSRQLEVYRAAIAAARDAGIGARAHVSRFDADGAVLWFTLLDGSGEALDDDAAAGHRDVVERAAVDAGGYALGSANPRLEPYFARLRAELDPHGILNPGALI